MLKQKILLKFSTNIILQIIQIIASIIVARVAGATVLGTIAFGTAYVNAWYFISGLGLGGAHIKFISEGRDEGQCITIYSIIKLFTTGFFVLFVVIFFLIQKYFFHIKFESKVHEYVIFITLIAFVIESFLTIPYNTFAGKIEIAKNTLPRFFQRILYQILRITVVLLGFKALTIAFSKLFSVILIIPVVLYFFKDYKFGSFDSKLAKEYLRLTIPLIILALSRSLIYSIDKIMLQFFTNSEYVGYYTAGYRFGSILLIVAGAVGIFFPLFSKAISEGNEKYIRDKIDKWERFIFLFVMPAVIFISIYSDSIILFVLGEKYINSITVLPIITVAMFIRLWTTPYGNVLTGSGLFVLVSKLEVLNLILFIVALVFFIHPQILGLKATGAALAVMISNIFSGCVFMYFSKRKLIILKKINNLRFIIFGITNFIVFFFLYKYFVEYLDSIFRIIFPLLYFTTTYFCLILLKWIRKDDLIMLKSLLDLKTMKIYVSGELKTKRK